MPLAKAMSPIRSSVRPLTSSSPGWPSPALAVAPPAAATARASASGCGVRTRTVWAELRAMNSAMLQSAMSRPRPITITWSAVFSISDIRWLDTSTVRPSAASDLIRLRIHRMPSGIQPVHRLVEHQDLRVAEQRRGDAEPLAHAERESLGPLPGHVGQPDDAEHLVHPAAGDVVGLGQAEQVVAGAAAAVHGLGVQQRAHLAHRAGQLLRTAGRSR